MKTINRRSFLRNTGIAAGAGLMMPAFTFGKSILPAKKYSYDTWADIRAQFNLTPDRIHLAQMLFATHPKPVQDAIELHRRKFDENPVEYLETNLFSMPDAVRKSAANFIKADPEEIVLTDSTTMGIAILYHGLKLKEGDEILTTTHDHYITEKALEFSTKKNGAVIRRIAEYDDPFTASPDEIVSRLVKVVTPATRIVAITWVHSCTGMKLPVRAIADAIKDINAKRSPADRIYLCVDGVHGFGIDNMTMEDLGCDFFAAGAHKWIFGPRGTGILWGKKDAWEMMMPVIHSFGYNSYGEWLGLVTPDKLNFGDWITPGGFKVYEHQWAMPAAFDFQLKIGKDKISEAARPRPRRARSGSLRRTGMDPGPRTPAPDGCRWCAGRRPSPGSW